MPNYKTIDFQGIMYYKPHDYQFNIVIIWFDFYLIHIEAATLTLPSLSLSFPIFAENLHTFYTPHTLTITSLRVIIF